MSEETQQPVAAQATEQKGISTILEELQALEDLAVCGAKIAADGKVDIKDLSTLVQLAGKTGEFVSAIKDAKEVTAEIKDLSQEELAQVVARLYQLVANVKAAKV